MPGGEFFDGVDGFIYVKEQALRLEHSLVSLSKWEAKWKKPFLSQKNPTDEEFRDYIRCMTVTQNVDPNVYRAIPPVQIRRIQAYIDDPMTATTVHSAAKSGGGREIVTSELIYYWMISWGIPFECQKWHLNRLLMLIRVCGAKSSPPKKIPAAELAARNRAINAARRKRWNTRG